MKLAVHKSATPQAEASRRKRRGKQPRVSQVSGATLAKLKQIMMTSLVPTQGRTGDAVRSPIQSGQRQVAGAVACCVAGNCWLSSCLNASITRRALVGHSGCALVVELGSFLRSSAVDRCGGPHSRWDSMIATSRHRAGCGQSLSVCHLKLWSRLGTDLPWWVEMAEICRLKIRRA